MIQRTITALLVVAILVGLPFGAGYFAAVNGDSLWTYVSVVVAGIWGLGLFYLVVSE